jgi:hypothetical protein
MIGELATNLPVVVDGGGGGMMGELATANPLPATRTEDRIATRTFSEPIIMDV